MTIYDLRVTICDPYDSFIWLQPVVQIGELGLEAFRRAANTLPLHIAFDQLVVEGTW